MKAQELIEKYKSGVRDFRQVNLERENLAWSILSDADFRGANLQHVNFKGAILHRVKFSESASLAFADLSGSELINADLRGTNLQGANLTGTRINAIVDEQTQLPRGFQARIQHDQDLDSIDDLVYKKQIEQLTKENANFQKQLEKDRQEAQLIITQMQGRMYDIENTLRNEKEQNLSARKNIESLTKEREHLQLTLQNSKITHTQLEEEIKNLKKDHDFHAVLQSSSNSLKLEILQLKEQLEEATKLQEEQARQFQANQWKETILQKAYSLPELSKLIEYLSQKRWQNADEETHLIILKISGLSSNTKNGLDEISIQRFPITALQTIDQLWMHYSNGHFGFTAQIEIWEKYRSIETQSDLKQIGFYLGWQQDEERCLWYEKLNFSLDVPQGHLPARIYDQWDGKGVVFHTHWISLLLNDDHS